MPVTATLATTSEHPHPNKYLYNGKELQDDHNLNMFDYGARFYNPALSQWKEPDRLAEFYFSFSPYNYVLGNPILYIDPYGLNVARTDSGYIITGNDIVTYYSDLEIISEGKGRLENLYEALENAATSHNGEGGPLPNTIREIKIKRESRYKKTANNNLRSLPTHYKEGIYTVDKIKWVFLPIGWEGLFGFIIVHGRANVFLKEDGITYANVSATATTPSSNLGEVSYYGKVDLISGGKVVASCPLKNYYTGPSIITPGWGNVGNAIIPLPQYGSLNVTLRLKIGYIFSGPEGRTPTWPATRSFYIPIPIQ